MNRARQSAPIFHVVMIKPTHYDRDGYPIQWLRSAIPSNTLACLNGLALDCQKKSVLGEDVEIRLHTYDETNKRVPRRRIVDMIRRDGGKGLIALVGVQSNQFPRAFDLARWFRAEDVQVAMGGFHVSGCLSMLPELPPELKEAQALGISLFAGEAEEGRLVDVFRDAYRGTLKPLYNFMDALPNIQGEPIPMLPHKHLRQTIGTHSSFDLGRGCPFQCSFCTIVNVQGRKSRFRSADDLERIIRQNVAQKVRRFFITDDNFARNKDWEVFFDRLIKLRREEDIRFKLIIQVDTLCHKIPNFIEKAKLAGVSRVFIGLENINPDNLLAARKAQNKITEYRTMIQQWQKQGIITIAGYILGFPADTKESILHDIEIIKRELPLDILEFFFLTPLPGSEDHQKMWMNQVWMDPDLNRYDLSKRVSHHPKMSDEEWEEAYREAWRSYYKLDHMETVMHRARAVGTSAGKRLTLMLWFRLMAEYEDVHPLEGGYFRLKFRTERRSGLPIESPLVFYPRYAREVIWKYLHYAREFLPAYLVYRRVKRDAKRFSYMDMALTEVSEADIGALEMFAGTRGGTAALEKSRKQRLLIDSARQGAAVG
jgi:radical SAM superfamily enzyme YgiQ (UPF0313 family)